MDRPQNSTRLAPTAGLLLIAGLLPATLFSGLAVAEPGPAPAEMLEDAELCDVQFIDAERGWAVGDRGAIWITVDGGRHWQLADSPVNCRLDAVHFVDPFHGWAVGGWSHPYTHKSSAVVLRTENGGQRWKRLDAPTLPALRGVHFLDRHQGWAVGSASAMYAAGIFRTSDGGRGWVPLRGAHPGGWWAASFHDSQQGMVVGRDGAAAHVTRGQLEAITAGTVRGKHFRDVAFAGRRGWLVGDGGLVMRSDDGGQTWQQVKLPGGVEHQFDFRAVAAAGEQCWVGGAPGARLWHTRDAGRHWEPLATPTHVPLAALEFIDPQRGWAVGALGTILATRDGGRSWSVQHRGGRRVAVLGVFSEAEQIPLELFARLCGDEGYLGAVEILNRRDLDPPPEKESTADQRAREAAAGVGASYLDSAWRFPLRQAGLQLDARRIVAGWDVVNQGGSVARLEEHVARKIRQWRPEVIVTENVSPDDRRPLAHLASQVVLSAARRAADAQAYPQQTSVAGLAAWQVQKIFAAVPDGEPAELTLETSRLATRLGRSLADQAERTRGLIADQWQPGPQRIGFQLLVNNLSGPAARRDFLSGTTLEPGGEARRAVGAPLVTNLESLTKTARKRRNIERLLDGQGDDPTVGASWLAQLDDLTGGLDSVAAGNTLYHLAQSYRQGGHHELAADVLRSLVERHPKHALADTSLMWLVQYYASAEVAHRTRSAGPDVERAGAVAAALPMRAARGAAPWRLTGATSSGGRDPDQQRAARALAVATVVRQTRPPLDAEPSLQLAIAAAQRKLGLIRDAHHVYTALSRSRLFDTWSQCARAELWLSGGKGLSPKPLAKCHHALAKPRLDGTLDDELWQQCEVMPLHSAWKDDQAWPGEARLAYDDEFLYLAVRCGKVPGRDYPFGEGPRPRDPDLTPHDRVDLLIDVDRDFGSHYRFTVDHRGWTGEACFGDASWNPDWYVACWSAGQEWIVEAAIPLAALSPHGARRHEAWAVGIQRVVPGVGFQSWTQPAAVVPRPEGFGYLQFN